MGSSDGGRVDGNPRCDGNTAGAAGVPDILHAADRHSSGAARTLAAGLRLQIDRVQVQLAGEEARGEERSIRRPHRLPRRRSCSGPPHRPERFANCRRRSRPGRNRLCAPTAPEPEFVAWATTDTSPAVRPPWPPRPTTRAERARSAFAEAPMPPEASAAPPKLCAFAETATSPAIWIGTGPASVTSVRALAGPPLQLFALALSDNEPRLMALANRFEFALEY